MGRNLLIAFTVLLACGCSEQFYLERKEDKLLGAWEFEKVFYHADGHLFRDNITHEYAYDIIEFYDDYTAIYDDYSLGRIFPGEWQMILDKDSNSEGSNREYFVDAVFFGMFQNEDFALFGSIDRLNRNKLHLEARDRYGCYTFKLRRL